MLRTFLGAAQRGCTLRLNRGADGHRVISQRDSTGPQATRRRAASIATAIVVFLGITGIAAAMFPLRLESRMVSRWGALHGFEAAFQEPSPDRATSYTPASYKPTFYKDVLPILQTHCQTCHRAGEIAPMPLVTYEQARQWSPSIRKMVLLKEMPPWFADPEYGHFANDPSLTPEQIQTLVAWTDNHAPAGDRRAAPPAVKWSAGWNIARPDAVLQMPTEVALPARGDIAYTYEIVPTGFTEDTWVEMSEVRACAESANMCITRWCTCGRLVRPGCGMRRLGNHSRQRI